jgi:cytoskeletal protein CcmA (bactofilin family)
MTETGLEKVVASTNGGAEARITEPKATVLAREDSLSGRLEVRGSGQVLGNFKGQIECDGDLTIGPDAHVEADIRTSRVTISGFVRGNVVALGRLKITNTGRLEGDARVGALVVEEGGVHYGVIRVHPEGVPESSDQVITDPEPRVVPSNLKALPNSVGRVRKLWGEFF